MEAAVIVSAARTPVGTFGGAFADVPAVKLGSVVVEEVLRRAGVDSADEVLMGNVLQAGLGQNPARQSAIGAGLDESVPSTTVNKVCGSGLKTVALAAQAIRAGDAECLVAGGMENMSRAPYLMENGRYGYRLGHGQLVDEMIRDGLWCAFDDVHMGAGTERYAKQAGISRQVQDELAAASHERAAIASKEGHFSDEIEPISVPQRKGDPLVVDADEGIRPDTTVDGLARLKPAFAPDGTITAGNASQISDGGAAVVVMSKAKAEELGIAPLAELLAFGNVA
ncbi:MAG TPA: acetyl-CoA C-acyltransferase, partial [Candidatus Dormibacteraeota bacterium]|nr:acetyl-CoA C-acyltransferase [Candidatus Dormibacteraeota bacterium]